MKKTIRILCGLTIMSVVVMKYASNQEQVVLQNLDKKTTKAVSTPQRRIIASSPSIKETKTPSSVLETKSRRVPADFKRIFYKDHSSDPFISYPKVAISKKYEVVQGIVGSFQHNPESIRTLGGMYFYEDQRFQGGQVVIFDKTQEKYALWTGEIIIEAPDSVFEKIQSKFDLELIQKSPGRGIFKSGLNFNVNSDLRSIEILSEIESIQLDLKFSKLQRQ